jgi:hypothetical protein
MNALSSVLQIAPGSPSQAPAMTGSFIFEAITAVSILVVGVGVFYVLMKLGRFLDAMREKA